MINDAKRYKSSDERKLTAEAAGVSLVSDKSRIGGIQSTKLYLRGTWGFVLVWYRYSWNWQ